MIIVSNTSPIINLANIDSLSLLNQLYGNIIIPTAVFHEIAVIGAGEPGAKEVQTLSWISTQAVQNLAVISSLSYELDAGEVEAIALALELKADLLLMDERRGCKVAQRMKIACSGVLGVLIKAKRQGLVVSVKPRLDDLIAKAGFWVDNSLYQQVLQMVGENVA